MAPVGVACKIAAVIQSPTTNGSANAPGRGGAAAISGFVYQLLCTSTRLLEVEIAGDEQDGEASSVIAFLEPERGGDLELSGSSTTCIQFKQRSRPLDAGELVDSVVRDLFSAHCRRACDRYELQCNVFLSGPAAAITDAMRSLPAGTASASPQLRRVSEVCRSIFERDCVRSHAGFEAEFAAFRARFMVAPLLDAAEARRRIAIELRRWSPYADRVDAEIDRIIGHLLQRSAQSSAQITRGELLELSGVFGVSASHADNCRTRLRTYLYHVLEFRDFDARFDAREPTIPSPKEPISLLAGPSGRGKTWSLCRTAHELNARGEAVVLIQAPDLTALETALRRHVAVDALGHESPIEPRTLGNLWRRRLGDPTAMLWVLWEGCRDLADLTAAQEALGLGEGMRLLAEVAPGQAVADTSLRTLPIYTVDDFTEVELFDALRLRGVDAGLVPNSVRRMLRMPVLCGLYARLALQTVGWEPTSEYAVLERFWQQAAERVHPLAGVDLKKLARQAVSQRRAQVSDETMVEIGISGDKLPAFVRAGWLIGAEGRWGFAHERLLTWAVAVSLAHDFDHGADPKDLAGKVCELLRDQDDKTKLQSLGFLTMDVLWLLMRQKAPPVRLCEFLVRLEQSDDLSLVALYADLLPTAGALILPYILERIRAETDEDRAEQLASAIAGGLGKVLGVMPERHEFMVALGAIENRCARSVLLTLGAATPLVSRHTEMWEQYVHLHRAMTNADIVSGRDQKLEAVLVRLASHDPLWLRKLLTTEKDPVQLALGASLLLKLSGDVSQPIWLAASGNLFDNANDDAESVLIDCINHFRDLTRVPWLIATIEGPGFTGPKALSVLCRIAPGSALEALASRAPIVRPPHGRIWLDCLLEHDALRATAAVREWLLNVDPSGGQLASAWLQAPGRLDLATTEAMLGLLDLSTRHSVSMKDRATNALIRVLSDHALRPPNAELLGAPRWQDLATRLTDMGNRVLDGSDEDTFDKILHMLLRARLKCGEELVLGLLRHPNELRLRSGIEAAYFSPTADVIAKLEDLACDWARTFNDGTRLDLWRVLQALAPQRWREKTMALLKEDLAERIHLGIFLLREARDETTLPDVIACLERSEPNSRTEALAMGLASFLGDKGGTLRNRAQSRFRRAHEDDDDGRFSTFNAMLADTTRDGRQLVDDYLATRIHGPSYSSYDIQLLVARLRGDDVDPALVEACHRLVRRPSFFGEDIVAAFARHAPKIAKSAALERAFAPPSVFTYGQPDAIRILASLDLALAEQAFVSSWRDHPERREALSTVVRVLGADALRAMVESLQEPGASRSDQLAFRRTCVELRRRHEEALPMLIARLDSPARGVRLAICRALGWIPGSQPMLKTLQASESDAGVRKLAYSTLTQLNAQKWAIDNFLAHPNSLRALDFMIGVTDPVILTGTPDEWGILSLIRSDIRLTMFCESRFAERFREVSSYQGRRLPFRPLKRAIE